MERKRNGAEGRNGRRGSVDLKGDSSWLNGSSYATHSSGFPLTCAGRKADAEWKASFTQEFHMSQAFFKM